jgi:hypothetical protein
VKDERLDELLRTLPREKASDDLTRRILEKLDQEEVRPTRARKLVFGFGLAALGLVAALSVFLWLSERARKKEIREQIATLQTEHKLLQARLQEMKRARPERPVVYLGGDDQVDYVLDLRNYLRAQVEGDSQYKIPLRYTGGSL